MVARTPDKAAHRDWIEQARRQTDEADRHSAQVRLPGRQLRSPFFAADAFPGYELQGEVHRGAQGVVYRALQIATRRTVALKILREGPFAGPADRARFEREVQVLAQLHHPDIVAIHDSGKAAGHFFLVMDYIDGVPLDQYAAANGSGLRVILELVARIGDAVNAAHLRGVIHRDLKPGNILVDADGAPHVLDFGLAKFVDPGPALGGSSAAATLTGHFIGSLAWCSPEQAAGAALDVRTDVYSLGVILYQLLTGRFPYTVSGAVDETLSAVRTHLPIRPRTVRRDIGDEVETILLKSLQKDPARRYQSAGEFARDLRHYLAGEPIEAKRDSGWYMLRKSLRRHRLAAGVAAAFVLVLAVFALAMASARLHAQREADKSRQVLVFLQRMLAGVDSEDPGRDTLTVHEMLDRAALRLEHELVDQPAVAASVHHTIGKQYNSLGLHQDADRHLRKAVDLRRSFTTGDDAELAEAISDFAYNLQEKGDILGAEPPTREALDMRRRLFGPDSLAVAESLFDLASVLMAEEYNRAALRPEQPALTLAAEAELLFRQSLEIRRRLLGPEHADVATGTGSLGWSLMALGRLDEAEMAMRDAVEMVRRLPGDNERNLAARLTFLSDVLRARGNLVDEEKTVREAIDIRSRRLAPDHPALAWNLYCLAQIRRKLGAFDEAHTACRKALDIYDHRRTAPHTDIANCQQVLAQICDAQSRHIEAERWWNACLDMRRKLLPAGHADLATAENGLAGSQAAQGHVGPAGHKSPPR